MQDSGLILFRGWAAKPGTASRLLALSLLVVIGALGWWYYQAQYRSLEQAKLEELNAIATLRVSEIANWRRERLADATVLMKAIPLRSSVLEYLSDSEDEDARRALLSWMTTYRDQCGYGRIALLDSNLSVRLAVPPNAAWVGPLASELARGAMRTQEILVSDLHVSQVSGRVNMDILVPIAGGKQSTESAPGAILLEVDPQDFLFPVLAKWPTPSKTAETVLLRQEGPELICLNELRHQTNTAMKLRVRLSDLVEQETAEKALEHGSLLRCLDYRRAPVLAALRPVPNSPWVVVSKQDEWEVNAPLRAQLWSMAATTGAIGIAGLLGLGYLNRSRKYKASLRELDARRQAEESLRQSVERFHSFTSSTFEGICLHEDARILEVNDQYAALFGYARDELIGKDIPALVAPESLSLVGEMINARSESVYAHRALRKDGSTFIAEVRGRKTVWEGREVRVAALRDVTERQRLQEALERKNKELESVIYISSHDLRSPLVNIQGFSHRLRTGCEQLEALLGPAETLSEVQEAATPILRDRLQPALSFILSSVLKMDGLLNGLLRLSRLGRSAMRIDDLDMNKIAAIATDSIAFELQNIGGCVSVGVLPPCRGDATQVAQVVSNLLDNALKYRDAQRPLRISIRGQVREGQCAYVVEDNGRGITHEHQEKIWEIFQRVDPAGPVKGEGLGLAIVRRILERHGGQAWVESGTDGKVGSRFWFTLPSAQKPTQPAAGAPTREGQAAEFSTTL